MAPALLAFGLSSSARLPTAPKGVLLAALDDDSPAPVWHGKGSTGHKASSSWHGKSSTGHDKGSTGHKASSWHSKASTGHKTSSWQSAPSWHNASSWHGKGSASHEASSWHGKASANHNVSSWHDKASTRHNESAWHASSANEHNASAWHSESSAEHNLSAWQSKVSAELVAFNRRTDSMRMRHRKPRHKRRRHAGRDLSDSGDSTHAVNEHICRARWPETTNWTSYGIDFQPNLPPPHVGLCKAARAASPESQLLSMGHKRRAKTAERAVIFKTARTGSTFFTGTTRLLGEAAGKQVSVSWEAFGRPSCYHNRTQRYEEYVLEQFLSKSCEMGHDLCTPIHDKSCREVDAKASMLVTAINPRFLDRTRWDIYFRKLHMPDGSVVMNLRRTNLVRMAYSKKHHRGCAMLRSFEDTDHIWWPNDDHRWRHSDFTLDMLLQCVWHFTLGDQEYASSAAQAAAEASGEQARLLLYEDVFMNEEQGGWRLHLASLLGIDKSFVPAVPTQRLELRIHDEPSLCNYDDVHCDESSALLPGLDAYPCLAKQWQAGESTAWSLPLLEDGTLHLKGDCEPLPPLAAHQERSHTDLYVFPRPRLEREVRLRHDSSFDGFDVGLFQAPE